MKERRIDTDIAVIGGGAAALALCAMLEGRRTAVFERGARAGKKLLATGNGKCNLSGYGVRAEDYNSPDFVRPFLEDFPPESAAEFFRSLGLALRGVGGRIYPYSECASSVLDVLMSAAADRGAELYTHCDVKEIRAADGGFRLEADVTDDKGNVCGGAEIRARAVVLATGSPATSGKDSLVLYEALGHTARPFRPSLVPVRTDRGSVKGLNGVRVKCAAELGGVREEGEILFRDYGLSGIAALNLSALYARGRAAKGDRIVLDFAPGFSEEEVARWIERFGGESAERVLRGMFHSRVAERIMQRAGQSPQDRPDARKLAATVKRYGLTLEGTADASAAQVMSGGLRTEEFDGDLCSRIVPGAYAVGEALDVDGLCGGCNLQWAWASAHAAARGLSRG